MPTPILMPRQGQSVESCILTAWTIKEGDTVKVGQIVASIETDKATFDVESPAEGTILARFFKEGDDIPVLTHIAAIGTPGEDFSGLRPGGSAAAEPVSVPTAPAAPTPAPAVSVPAPSASVPTATVSVPTATAAGVSPRARHLAAAKGVDAQSLAGSGPGGRVIERDVAAAAASGAALSPAARDALAGGGLHAPAHGSGPGGRILAADLQKGSAAPARIATPVLETKEIPVTGIRKIIAQRMMASLTSTAQLTINRSFDATAIQSFRRKLKSAGKTFNLPQVTINDLIVYAVAKTLVRHPELNAHFLGTKIVQHGSVNLGIAVDTPRGLMVPVLRNAETMSLREISASVRPLAEACQKGSINPDNLSGGTFTITNLGSLGIESFTPVLNAPEVAILGVCGLTLKPVRTAHGVEHVDAINLSLTIDHQAVDGAPAARFLKDLCEALENIELLLAARD